MGTEHGSGLFLFTRALAIVGTLSSCRTDSALLMHSMAAPFTSIEQGGGHHFFENHDRYAHEDQRQILFHNSPTTNRIISLVGEKPGITRSEIADRPGLAGPSVTRWVQRFIADGMVTEVHEGRCVRQVWSNARLPGSSFVTMDDFPPGIQTSLFLFRHFTRITTSPDIKEKKGMIPTLYRRTSFHPGKGSY